MTGSPGIRAESSDCAVETAGAAAAGDLTLAVFRGREGLASLVDDWRRLAERCAEHYLHLPEWYLQKVTHLDDTPDTACFLAYYDRHELVAVIPLKREKCTFRLFGIRTRVPAWCLYYPDDMGVCDGTVAPAYRGYRLFRRLAADLRAMPGAWQLLYFRDLPGRGHALALMQGGGLLDPLIRPSHASKYLDATADYNVSIDAYPKKFLRNLRRKQNKLAGMGEVSCRFVRDAQALPAAYEQFVFVEGSGWKGERGTALQEQPRKRAFYEDLARSLGGQGRLGVHLLMLDGRPIAAQLAVYAGRSVYLLKIGHDERYNAVSPGFLLVNRLWEYACGQPDIDRVSFVTGTGWMDVWKPASEPVYSAYYCRIRALNVLLKAAERLNRRIRRT